MRARFTNKDHIISLDDSPRRKAEVATGYQITTDPLSCSTGEGVGSRGRNRPRQDFDRMTTLDIDDDVADDEVLLPLVLPVGCSLVSSAPAALTRALVNQEVMLRLCMDLFREVITRKAQARTNDRYDFRVFIETGGSTRSVKLPLAKYSVGGAMAEGSWVLLSHCADEYSSKDDESEDELEDDEEKSGGREKSVVVSRGRGGGVA